MKKTIDKHIYFSYEEYANINNYCINNNLSFSKGVSKLLDIALTDNELLGKLDNLEKNINYLSKKLNVTYLLLEQLYADLDFENVVDPKDSVSLSKFNAKLRGKKYYD